MDRLTDRLRIFLELTISSQRVLLSSILKTATRPYQGLAIYLLRKISLDARKPRRTLESHGS